MRSLWGGLALAALVCACDPVTSGETDGVDSGLVDGGAIDADTTPDAQMCNGPEDCVSGHCLDSVCVECESNEHCTTGQVCDAEEHVCRGCETALDCESQVCEPVEHTCVPEEKVVYVASSGTNINCGSKAMPCAQFRDGLPLVTPDRPYISVFGTHMYERYTLSGRMIIVGNGKASFDLAGSSESDSGPIFTIKEGSEVTFDGVTIQNNPGGAGIECGQGKLRVTNSLIGDNSGAGINGVCELHLEGSEVVRNERGVEAGKLTVWRNRIHHNRWMGVVGDASGADVRGNLLSFNSYEWGYSGAIHLQGGTTADPGVIAYNTIVANQTNGYERGNVACISDTATVLLDSNVLWDHRVTSTGGVDPIKARVTGCQIGKNVSDVQLNLETITGDPLFVDAATENYQISAGSSASGEGKADLALPLDLDGKPRGSEPDMGAFELP